MYTGWTDDIADTYGIFCFAYPAGKSGVVVSLEDLFHSVWKDEYYSKNSSTSSSYPPLREKLKDTAEKPQYIKTIWGVGYKI